MPHTLGAMAENNQKEIFKRARIYRGLAMRVAKKCRVCHSHVLRVMSLERKSPGIEAAIVKEVERIEATIPRA